MMVNGETNNEEQEDFFHLLEEDQDPYFEEAHPSNAQNYS
jgi:hypothetical protein